MTYLRLAESLKTMNRSDRNALWRLTQDSLEVSGESSGKIFWSISTYLSLVTVTVLPAKEIIESIPAKILPSHSKLYCSHRKIEKYKHLESCRFFWDTLYTIFQVINISIWYYYHNSLFFTYHIQISKNTNQTYKNLYSTKKKFQKY